MFNKQLNLDKNNVTWEACSVERCRGKAASIKSLLDEQGRSIKKTAGWSSGGVFWGISLPTGCD